MKRHFWTATTVASVTLLFSSIPARAQTYVAEYSGFQEVGGVGAGETGAILSTGHATLKLTVDKAAQTLTYSLTYSGLSNVLQAHIHFGKNIWLAESWCSFAPIWVTVQREPQPALTMQRVRLP